MPNAGTVNVLPLHCTSKLSSSEFMKFLTHVCTHDVLGILLLLSVVPGVGAVGVPLNSGLALGALLSFKDFNDVGEFSA